MKRELTEEEIERILAIEASIRRYILANKPKQKAIEQWESAFLIRVIKKLLGGKIK